MKDKWYAFGLYAFYMLPIMIIFPIQLLGKNDYAYAYGSDFLSFQSIVAYVCLLMVIVGCVFVCMIYFKLDSVATGIVSVKNEHHLEFEYVPTIATLLAFVTFDYSCWRGLLIFLILMLFLALIAMNTPLFYTSPLFPNVGIHVYQITRTNNTQIIGLVKGELKDVKQLCCFKLSRNIYYCKVSKS